MANEGSASGSPVIDQGSQAASGGPAAAAVSAVPQVASSGQPIISTNRRGSSPAAPASPLPTPSAPLPANAVPPPSPGGSSSNRFGLSLNFMQRRPRGSTNPNGMSRPAFGGSGSRSPANSPGTELSPEPAASSPNASTERSGYGFPALRRTLSKRTNTADSSRRMRSRSTSQGPLGEPIANSAGSSNEAIVPAQSQPVTPAAVAPAQQQQPTIASTSGTVNAETAAAAPPDRPKYRIRLVPHLESSRSLHFEPVDRELTGFTVLKVGRFTDRSQNNAPDPLKIAFKSKVVSRGHAEIWVDDNGKWFIKDTKSSSGTFLNHIRLSGPGIESRPFGIKDGDILQLGVDYQGGTEEIYRCVKIKVELNRGWQRGMNSFNTAALAQLRALGGPGLASSQTTTTGGSEAPKAVPAATKASLPTTAGSAATASVTDCCICLYPVTVCQALFIAPCSHVTHFKCIRPLVNQNYPGFSCPLCRTYADLEADVEIEPWEAEDAPEHDPTPVVHEEPEEDSEMHARESTPARSSQDRGLTDEDLAGAVEDLDTAARTSSRPVSISLPSHGPNTVAHDALADAATPPNSTFLSTLADSGTFARFKDKNSPHVSLDHVMTTAAASPLPTAGPSRSSGSEDEQMEELRSEEQDSGTGLNDDVDLLPSSLSSAQKGKGRAADSGDATATETADETLMNQS